MTFDTNTVLDIKGVARLTNLTQAYLYRLMKTGKMPAGEKIGNARIWTADAVNDWWNSRKENVKNA